jgi:hypothetical protein
MASRLAGLASLLCAASLAGCTGGASSGQPGSLPNQSLAVTAGPSSPCGHAITLRDDANGSSVSACVGQRLTVALGSTYWSGPVSSNPLVLQPLGGPQLAPASPGTCVPGAGCGTLTESFVAAATGTATVTATRTLCGEDVQCPASQRAFAVRVAVQ